MLQSLCNSKYCKIFKSIYFEEHLHTAASENVLMKLNTNQSLQGVLIFHLKNRFFQHQYQEQVKMFLLLHNWFPISLCSHTIFLGCGDK